MRTNLIALAILLTVGFAAFLRAEPAQCWDCMTSGITCHGDIACGQGCRCIRPDGLGKPGFCG